MNRLDTSSESDSHVIHGSKTHGSGTAVSSRIMTSSESTGEDAPTPSLGNRGKGSGRKNKGRQGGLSRGNAPKGKRKRKAPPETRIETSAEESECDHLDRLHVELLANHRLHAHRKLLVREGSPQLLVDSLEDFERHAHLRLIRRGFIRVQLKEEPPHVFNDRLIYSLC